MIPIKKCFCLETIISITIVLYIILFLNNSAQAQDYELNPIGGFIRADIFVPALDEEQQFNNIGTTLSTKFNYPASESASFFAELRTSINEVRGSDTINLDLREAYINLNVGILDIRAGKQIIVWGKADAFSPIDNLSIKDMAVFSPDEDDRRKGSTAIKTDLYLGEFHLTGVLQPAFSPGEVLFPDESPKFIQDVVPSNMELSLNDLVNKLPESRLNNSTFAFNLEFTQLGIDFSFNYFNGYSSLPQLKLELIPSIQLILDYTSRIQVIGSGLSTTIGAFGINAEVAYTITEIDDKEKTYYEELPYFIGVFALEFDLIDEISTTIQYMGKWILDYKDLDKYGYIALPDELFAKMNNILHKQQYEFESTFLVRFGYMALQDTLDINIVGMYNLKAKDYMIRPKLTYKVDDASAVICGMEFYDGPDESLYGMISDFSSFFFSLKYSF